MKTNLLIIIVIIFVWSCGSKYESEEGYIADYEKSTMPMQVNEEVLGSADTMAFYSEQSKLSTVGQERTRLAKTSNQTGHFRNPLEYLADTLYLRSVRLSKKFIKTADLRFKVENVENTTRNIEKLTLRLGGYIQQSQIRSNYVSSRYIEVSSDTVMEVLEYYVDNNMSIRVPSIYFDSVLTEIGKEHIYLDRRDVKTEDVSTIFLRNKLKAEKRTEYEKRIQKAVEKAPRKLDDIVVAEKQASDLADIAIDKKIDNYNLQDRIDFSTISLNFYQANTIHKDFVENTRLTEYQPSFWQRAWKALQVGWKVVLEIIIGLLYLWPLYLIAIAVIFLIKYIRKRTKK